MPIAECGLHERIFIMDGPDPNKSSSSSDPGRGFRYGLPESSGTSSEATEEQRLRSWETVGERQYSQTWKRKVKRQYDQIWRKDDEPRCQQIWEEQREQECQQEWSTFVDKTVSFYHDQLWSENKSSYYDQWRRDMIGMCVDHEIHYEEEILSAEWLNFGEGSSHDKFIQDKRQDFAAKRQELEAKRQDFVKAKRKKFMEESKRAFMNAKRQAFMEKGKEEWMGQR